MKERPILFSGPMVRAILGGCKTQTRRVMAIPPVSVEPFDTHNVLIYQRDGHPITQWYRFDRHTDALIELTRPGVELKPTKARLRSTESWLASYRPKGCKWSIDEVVALCPYGVPGDHLWVRETLSVVANWGSIHYVADDVLLYDPDFQKVGFPYCVEAEAIVERYGDSYHANDLKCVPSIFMPRWASRITLEITEVRVQRVQGISEEDAIAEGISGDGVMFQNYFKPNMPPNQTPRSSYYSLWDSINAKRGFGWDKNPWVWAISYKRIGG